MSLPEEIQIKILSFLRHDEVVNVKLVSRKFYIECCKIQSYQYPLVIIKQKLDDFAAFDAILASKIKFEEMIIDMDQFAMKDLQKVMAILVFHGRNIKTLHIQCNSRLRGECMAVSAIVTWFSYMPALEYASFMLAQEISSLNLVQTDNISIPNLPKNLERVRFPPVALASVLHRLPRSSLESLLLNNSAPLPNIKQIFERHRDTLTELEFYRFFPYTDPTIFHPLQLEVLNFLGSELEMSDQFLVDVFTRQKKLKFLRLGEAGSFGRILAGEAVLRAICGLKELRKLEIAIHVWTPSHVMWQLAQLKNLEKIRIDIPSAYLEHVNERFEVFTQTRIPNLKSLEISGSLQSNHMCNLRNSYRDLEVLHCDLMLTDEEEEETGSFNFILDSFPKLRKLILVEPFYTFTLTSHQYESLEILRLWCGDGNMEIKPELIKALPNLHTLHVEAMEARIDTFEAILASKIIHCNIKIPFRLLHNVVQLKKLKNQIIRKSHCCCVIKIIK